MDPKLTLKGFLSLCSAALAIGTALAVLHKDADPVIREVADLQEGQPLECLFEVVHVRSVNHTVLKCEDSFFEVFSELHLEPGYEVDGLIEWQSRLGYVLNPTRANINTQIRYVYIYPHQLSQGIVTFTLPWGSYSEVYDPEFHILLDYE